MHPLNFVRDDFMLVRTTGGARKVSKRKYKVSNKYRGTLNGYVGKIVRLVDLNRDREIGEHIDDYLAVTLDEDISSCFGDVSYVYTVGIQMMYLEPIER